MDRESNEFSVSLKSGSQTFIIGFLSFHFVSHLVNKVKYFSMELQQSRKLNTEVVKEKNVLPTGNVKRVGRSVTGKKFQTQVG